MTPLEPAHYRDRDPQPIDVIEGWGLNFNRGAVIKYIARAPYKENELQDLKKAAWYLNREIERLTSFGGAEARAEGYAKDAAAHLPCNGDAIAALRTPESSEETQ